MRKKILIFLSLVIILTITGGIYWYLNVYQKPEQPAEKLEAKKILEEWLNVSLKPEFLPTELNIELGVDIGGGVARDENTYGYNWNILEKNFYTAIDYNNEKPGINAYILVVFWNEKIDLDQETAQELLEKYINFSKKPNLICETREKEKSIDVYCQGNWIDLEENRHKLFISSVTEKEEDSTFLMYSLVPVESETYEKI